MLEDQMNESEPWFNVISANNELQSLKHGSVSMLRIGLVISMFNNKTSFLSIKQK